MTASTFSSRQFNQDVSRIKKAAQAGPVFITDRGQPAHVLLTFDAYRQLTKSSPKIADLLAFPGTPWVELETPVLLDKAQPAEFT
jgi:hypothetical protein